MMVVLRMMIYMGKAISAIPYVFMAKNDVMTLMRLVTYADFDSV